ncbi:hypothetical protein SAMN05421839_1153 [Halolactibacillus halophilus]|uniref:Uncharacterized protein n=1 Tax=Halolactibacillus halophilus TaxID=306540 RepID=A0A1I5PIL1_9BACI|nr:hypothetical protein [Halolactibacillus halophilus]GEM02025.1 hypothetical protein HHA03_15570 [Halolactibacillus halophilus]SFP33650.1 hypothetical protein SAMN05421839_1153 [Halolactibacillus halophilus]
MRKQMRNQSIIWVIVVLVMFLIGTSVLLYQEHEADKRAFQSLLNRVYMEVDNTLHTLSLISENSTADDAYVERLFINLEVRLTNITTLLEFAELTVDDTDFPNSDFARIAAYTSVEDYGEEAYVNRVQELLTHIKEAMYSEEHNQEDPSLTPEAFNTIVEEATNQAREHFN